MIICSHAVEFISHSLDRGWEATCWPQPSAAFQENVSRQGADNFPGGIAILTAADYFNLGNMGNRGHMPSLWWRQLWPPAPLAMLGP